MLDALSGKELALIGMITKDPDFSDRFATICKDQADHRRKVDRAIYNYVEARNALKKAEQEKDDAEDRYQAWYDEHASDFDRLFGEYVKAHSDCIPGL